MEILSNYLVRTKGEKLKSFKYDNLKKGPNDDFSAYQEYLPLIEKCYKQDLYWHGTGRYHYEYNMNSREEKANYERVFDVLESLINRKAVVAHHDLFVDFSTQGKKTISLTPCRMYGRCYAEIHQYEANPLSYEYGDVAFWMNVIVPLQAIAILGSNPIRNYFPQLVNILKQRKTGKKVSGWISTFRNINNKKSYSIFHLGKIRSDIQNNHGILLAFKKNNIKTYSFDRAIEKFEARTHEDIPTSSLSHIEVPVANLQEVKDFLKNREIDIPVIPIEFGERYCNKFSLRELLGWS